MSCFEPDEGSAVTLSWLPALQHSRQQRLLKATITGSLKLCHLYTKLHSVVAKTCIAALWTPGKLFFTISGFTLATIYVHPDDLFLNVHRCPEVTQPKQIKSVISLFSCSYIEKEKNVLLVLLLLLYYYTTIEIFLKLLV